MSSKESGKMKGVGESSRNGARVEVASLSAVLVFGGSWRMKDDKREARSGPRLPRKHTNGTENGGKSGKVDSQARERNRNRGWATVASETRKGNRGGELSHGCLALDEARRGFLYAGKGSTDK